MASTESLVGFVLNSSLKNFGDIYVSALAILQSAMQFASVPLTGFAHLIPLNRSLRFYKRRGVDRYRPLGHAHLLGGYDDFWLTTSLPEYVRSVGTS